MPTFFEQLAAELPYIRTLRPKTDATGFFLQEVMRFYSIAGTLLSNGFTLDEHSSADERYLTHPLSRSLMENYFAVMYLFDDPAQTVARYDQLMGSFKDDYRKLLNDLNQQPWKSVIQASNLPLERANPAWSVGTKLPNVQGMITAIQNNARTKLGYLYPIYRITSFDTHGRSLAIIFETVFGKTCNFPVLKIKYAFDLMANQYLVVLNDLRATGSI